ncbi:DNA cytosine methyltransferase [Marinobacter arenosus]|uniref:DNA cytosine methyltransferase n=1 Tax=Marinobacter arenosus TaxID=2856822 RepID=UPI001C4DC7A4|nr:DNA cytosine methyltransferase [Marinobacter arenosus]MBW0147865.1 DNA cytosine methyltransferase [Marinobacter arenosus]
MKFIDLFSGCGGLSLGLLNAGYTGLFAVERSADAFSTLKRNLIDQEFVGLNGRFDWPNALECRNHDILALLDDPEASRYLDSLGNSGEVDLVAGGPPCQGFSSAGKRDPDDPRNQLAFAYLEIVRRVKPKFILMENVRGITQTFTKAGSQSLPPSEQIERALAELNYVPFHLIENSSQWGVPQARHRFVLIAIHKDQFLGSNVNGDSLQLLSTGKELATKVEAQLKVFAEEFKINKGLPPLVTASDALKDLKTLNFLGNPYKLVDVPKDDSRASGFKQIAEYAPTFCRNPAYINLMRKGWERKKCPNHGLRLPNHTVKVKKRFEKILEDIDDLNLQTRYKLARGKTLPLLYRQEVHNSRKHSLTVLDPHKPSGTVTTLPDDILHFDEPRIMTVRELARLQSFPDWFRFEGPYTTGGSLRKKTCPKYTQVGNAVPPLMAEGIGLFLKESLGRLLHIETGKIEKHETQCAQRAALI